MHTHVDNKNEKKKLHGGIRDAWIFKYVLINTYKLIKDEPKEYIYIEREREREREREND
jgi:hypothetical protein